MNKRQLDIIEKLSSAYRKFNISELADECKVSERTIRKDLDKINELLEENKIGRLVLKMCLASRNPTSAATKIQPLRK